MNGERLHGVREWKLDGGRVLNFRRWGAGYIRFGFLGSGVTLEGLVHRL
jgi:hypothetical protein